MTTAWISILLLSAAFASPSVSIAPQPQGMPRIQYVPPGGGAPSAGTVPPDAAVQEAAELQKQMLQQVAPINAANPLNTAPIDPAALEAAQAANPQLAQLQKALNNPAVQTYMKVFTNPEILQGVKEMAEHPARGKLMFAELGAILFMIFFKAWRSSKSTHWLAKIWVSLYCFVLGTLLTSVAVPTAILGTSYLTLAQKIFAAFRS